MTTNIIGECSICSKNGTFSEFGENGNKIKSGLFTVDNIINTFSPLDNFDNLFWKQYGVPVGLFVQPLTSIKRSGGSAIKMRGGNSDIDYYNEKIYKVMKVIDFDMFFIQ